MVGEEEKARGVGRGSRAVAELIKRSLGHIKGGPDQEDVTPLLGKIKLTFGVSLTTMCLHVHVSVCSSSLEMGGSWFAGSSSVMFGRVPARQRGW